MAIILISQGFRGVDFLRKPSVYLHFKAFAGPTIYAKTANRSVVGMMNEFAFLAEAFRDRGGLLDPLALSLKLAAVPCGPLRKGAGSPDRAVRELVAGGDVH